MLKANSVVLLGDFNPAIFSPDWLRKYVSISVDDGGEAEIKMIHPEITEFMLADIQFTFERNRVTLRTMVHEMEVLVSAILQMFHETLKHTPVWAYGMNLETHEDFGNFDARNRLGRLLCPIDPWGDWASGFDNKDPELNGGMYNITMKKPISKDPEIFQNFAIQPSNREELQSAGVFFAMNNHFGRREEQGKNNEGFRNFLFGHMRENVVTNVKGFQGLVKHFKEVGGVNG